MNWYYNSNTGAIEPLPDALIWPQLHAGLGWHGPFPSHQAAMDYYNSGKAANPGWKAPTDNPLTAADNAAKSAAAPITDVTGAITGAANTVVKLVPRVLEAAVGIVLLAIAANAIVKRATGVDVAGSAVRTGRKAAGTAAKAAVVA